MSFRPYGVTAFIAMAFIDMTYMDMAYISTLYIITALYRYSAIELWLI